MKHIYQDALKPYLREQIISAVENNHLTKDEAAELLAIDTRTFAYLKAGKSMCSTATLLMYLIKLCPDTERFLQEISEIVAHEEEKL